MNPRRLAHSCLLLFAAAVLLAPTAASARDWPGLLARLGSVDYVTRTAAQEELDRVKPEEFETLKSLTVQASDPEVHARLAARLPILEMEVACTPAPIALDIENATFADTRQALSRAIGRSLLKPPEIPDPPDTFRWTLKAESKTFWEVFTDLSNQHPLQFGLGPKIWSARPVDGAGIQQGQQFGGFFVVPKRTIRTRQLSTNPPPETVQWHYLEYEILVDPRICVVASRREFAETVVDDRGITISEPLRRPDRTALIVQRHPSCDFFQSVRLRPPENHGQMIATFAGTAEFFVGVGEERLEKNIEEITGPLTIANNRITLQDVHIVEGQNGLVTFTYDTQQLQPYFEKPDPSTPVTTRMVDAAGRELWNTYEWWEQKKAIIGPVKRPVKIILTAPAKTAEVRFPFVFKNLALPE